MVATENFFNVIFILKFQFMLSDIKHVAAGKKSSIGNTYFTVCNDRCKKLHNNEIL